MQRAVFIRPTAMPRVTPHIAHLINVRPPPMPHIELPPTPPPVAVTRMPQLHPSLRHMHTEIPRTPEFQAPIAPRVAAVAQPAPTWIDQRHISPAMAAVMGVGRPPATTIDVRSVQARLGLDEPSGGRRGGPSEVPPPSRDDDGRGGGGRGGSGGERPPPEAPADGRWKVVALALAATAMAMAVAQQQEKERESTPGEAVRDPAACRTEKDVAKFLTGAANNKELVDIGNQKAAFDPKAFAERLGQLSESLDKQARDGTLPKGLEQMQQTLRDTGQMNIKLSPGSGDHCYLNVMRTEVSPEKLAHVARGTEEPQRAFCASMPFGAEVSDIGTSGTKRVGLGPFRADVVESTQFQTAGGTAINNHTTKDHALVGDVLYGAHADAKTNTVTQVVIGVGEGHAWATGKANLATQEPLFGGMMKSSLAVMEEIGKAKEQGREVSQTALESTARAVPKTLAENMVAISMAGSGPYQAVYNAGVAAAGLGRGGPPPPAPSVDVDPRSAAVVLHAASSTHGRDLHHALGKAQDYGR